MRLNVLSLLCCSIGLCFLCHTNLQAQLIINELMASNDSVVADELGEYDDWIEIYNAGSSTVNIGGYHLSDRFDNLDKWVFPPGVLVPADGYITVWVDKDDEQGNLHTSFKLSGGGERIILSNADLAIVDSTGFAEQLTDISYARVPNATGQFVFHSPTFGTNNDGGEILDTMVMVDTVIMAIRTVDLQQINIYPNPIQSHLFVDFEKWADFTNTKIQLMDLSGKVVFEQELLSPNQKVSLPQISNGLYLLSVKTPLQLLYSQKVLIEN